MTAALGLGLLALALLDSTSFGTLLIPIWLLLVPGRLKPARVIRYLVAITIFYFLAGVVLAAGALQVVDEVHDWFTAISPTTMATAQLIIGVGLIALSYWLEAAAKRRQGQPGRLTRWREQAMTDVGDGGGITKLALVAATLEVLTMVPYLIAIGLLATADLRPATFAGALATYCLVMILPAALLLLLRIVAHEKIDPFLQRISDWFSKNSAKAIGWTVGGIGIGLAINATVRLIA